MISERQQHILQALIREYISIPYPVGSDVLSERYNLGVSPATIRAELSFLMDEGFLDQPHTSAGRIPTDKAYRFFVEYSGDNNQLREMEQERLERLFVKRFSRGIDTILQRAAETISELSHSMSISLAEETEKLHREGIRELLAWPDVQNNARALSEYIDVLDHLESDIERLFGMLYSSETRVFVGKENPLTKSDNFSIIVSGFTGDENKRRLVALIGPKRMDYRHNIALVSAVRRMLGGE